MFDWDDLRLLLAVARAGTTLGASRKLGISQPTVVRRLAAFEAAAGVALFDRRRTGYALTDAARELVPLAERIEADAAAIAQLLTSRARRATSAVRVTAAEPLVNLFLAPAVAVFRRSHPGVEVQLLISDDFVDLANGDADVALRATVRGMEDSDLVGRRLADFPWAVYCSHAYALETGVPRTAKEVQGHAILSAESLGNVFPALRWLEEAAPEAQVVWRSDSLASLQSAARTGLGLVTLPCILGGSDPELVKCFDAGGERVPEIWILTSPEGRRRRHVRAFADALSAEVRGNVQGLRGGLKGE
jgi:DNA-binding transcriptional LysR family regulator